MMYVELCDKVEQALDGRASYAVTLTTDGIRNVQTGKTHRKRRWRILLGPAWQSVESNTPEGAYAAFEAALLPLLEGGGDQGDVGV